MVSPATGLSRARPGPRPRPPRPGFELGASQDGRDVVLDGARRDVQPLRDLAVPEPVDEQLENLYLAVRQAGRAHTRRRAWATADPPDAAPAQPPRDDRGRGRGPSSTSRAWERRSASSSPPASASASSYGQPRSRHRAAAPSHSPPSSSSQGSATTGGGTSTTPARRRQHASSPDHHGSP